MWKGILLRSLFVPKGFDDPEICKKNKWKKIKINNIKGKMKCNEKNRFSVALLIENPPQIHITIEFPVQGIEEIKFVITVAPQKDICPQGNTYPKNAIAIEIKKIEIPINHVWIRVYELQ